MKKIYLLLLFVVIHITMAANTLQYCGVPQCKICTLQQLGQATELVSLVSNKHHQLDIAGSCKTSCCIYVITCKNKECQKAYVGLTKNPLNKHLSGHRANIINKTEGQAMYEHFCNVHNISDMMIQPLEVVQDPKKLRDREKYWICELNTAYPYGLNDRLDFGSIHDTIIHFHSNSDTPIYSIFNKVKNDRVKTSKKPKAHPIASHNSLFSPESFINGLTCKISPNIVHECKVEIMKLKISKIRQILLFLSKSIDEGNTKPSMHNEHIYHIVKDICLHKVIQSRGSTTKKSRDNFIVIKYSNRFIDSISIPKLLHSSDIQELFPIKNENFSCPSISYQYSKTIRSSITNYKDISDTNSKIPVCQCHNYPQKFIDPHHKHILTGDLSIIKHKQLRNLLKKA